MVNEFIEMLIEFIVEHKDELEKGEEVLIKEVIKYLIKKALEALGNQKKQKRR